MYDMFSQSMAAPAKQGGVQWGWVAFGLLAAGIVGWLLAQPNSPQDAETGVTQSAPQKITASQSASSTTSEKPALPDVKATAAANSTASDAAVVVNVEAKPEKRAKEERNAGQPSAHPPAPKRAIEAPPKQTVLAEKPAAGEPTTTETPSRVVTP